MDTTEDSCCHVEVEETDSDAKEYLKFALVFLGILGATWLVYSLFEGDGFEDLMRIFMGLFMLTFAAFKLIGYRLFIDGFQTYDLIAKRYKAYAMAFPFIELGLGLLFILDLLPTLRNVGVIGVMGIGALGVYKSVFIDKNNIRCACLGGVINLPLSTVSLVENTLMVLMAAIMLTL